MFTAAFGLLLLMPQLVDRTEAEPEPALVQDLSHERRGDIFMARKMYREAVEEYRKAIDEQPRSPRLHNKLGISFHHQLNFADARKQYERAFRLDEKYSQAINNLGTVYYAERKYKKAQKAYQKALKISPNSASIHSNLGTAFFARRKFKQATEAYVQALALDPNVFEHRNESGTLLQERSVEDRAKYHFFMAKAYAEAEMYDRALLYLRRCLEEGYSRDKILDEKEFEPLHETAEFQALMNPPAEGEAATARAL